MFWYGSAADPSLPLYCHCKRRWQCLGRGIAAPARYPATRGVSRTASTGSTCASRQTHFKLWMAPVAHAGSVLPRSGDHFVQVGGHVPLSRLTRVNVIFKSPFRPERPLQKVLAECPSCGPGNTLANVEVQVSALSQIRDQFGCVSKFHEYQTLPMVLCLVAAVLLTCFRISVFVRLGTYCRLQRACRTERGRLNVAHTTFEGCPVKVCQARATGCVVLGPRCGRGGGKG